MSAPSSPPQGEGWRLRPYRPGDERFLVAEFNRIFGREMTEELWRWKLKTRASPTENVWVAADERDRPIFQYAALPRRLWTARGERWVLVLVDLFVSAPYRDRRIFSTCCRWIHESWRRDGVAGVLSPFNAPREERYRRLGWRYLFPLRWRIRPLRPEAIVARRLGVATIGRARFAGWLWNRLWDFRAAGRPRLRALDGSDLEPPEQSAQGRGWARGDERFLLERSPSWLEWRYLSCPRCDYRVLSAEPGSDPPSDRGAGYVACRLDRLDRRTFAYLPELVATSAESERALLDAAIEHCRTRGAVAVATLASPRTRFDRALRRRGFLFSWGSFFVHWLGLSEDLRLSELRDPEHWLIAGGDFDVV